MLRPVLTALSIHIYKRGKVEWSTGTCKNPLRHGAISHGCHVVAIIEKEKHMNDLQVGRDARWRRSTDKQRSSATRK